jgi:hypothetical protein
VRFYLVLGAILAIGVFCFRSCSEKLTGGKEKKPAVEKVEKVPQPAEQGTMAKLLPASLTEAPEVAGPPRPAGFPGPSALPYSRALGFVTESYVFRNRVVPSASAFASSRGNSSSALSVTVDAPANAIVISGPLDAVRSLKVAARELDLESGEAYCDAWMLFVRGDKVKSFEASLEYSGGGFFGEAGGKFSSDGFGVALPLGTLRANLEIMRSNGILEVVDRPQLRLSSGHKAEVSTGEEVPFPTTVIRDGIATTSIEFKRVGLLFAVEPLFLGGGRVRMDVSAENGLLGATRRIGDVEVPSITRQSVRAAATLGYDDAMIIGGLETVRRERRFGLFGEKNTESAGRLYVAIMLRSGYPKASPVIGPAEDFDLLPPLENGSPGEYGDRLFPDGIPTVGGVLPPLGWEQEERRFLKGRSGK